MYGMLLTLLVGLIQLTRGGSGECGTAINRPRIVGGEDSGGLHYPWFALLRLRVHGNPPVCAGTLITSSHVLTAAHCFKISPSTPDKDLFTVSLNIYDRCNDNEPGRETYDVESVVVHKDYSSDNKFHDIALMKLMLQSNLPVACLPQVLASASEAGLIIGFGVMRQGSHKQPCHLQQATVTKYTSQQCLETSLPAEDASEPTTFCGGGPGIDSCQGDSGGPFLTWTSDGKYIVSGIVSFGYGCANDDYPGIYTNVASYLDWISENIAGTSKNENNWKHGIEPTGSIFQNSRPNFRNTQTEDIFGRPQQTPSRSEPNNFPSFESFPTSSAKIDQQEVIELAPNTPSNSQWTTHGEPPSGSQFGVTFSNNNGFRTFDPTVSVDTDEGVVWYTEHGKRVNIGQNAQLSLLQFVSDKEVINPGRTKSA